MMLFARKRFDLQPTEPVRVVLATSGGAISPKAIQTTIDQAHGLPVAVLAILRVHGSQFGLPNPGLLPTRKERDDMYEVLNGAISALESAGVKVDGQIAITRAIAKRIVNVVVKRAASVLVMDDSPSTGMRRKVEGDVTGSVKRRLSPSVKFFLVGSPTEA